MDVLGCIVKGWATTESEGGNGSEFLRITLLDRLAICSCRPMHGDYLDDAPAFIFAVLTRELIEQRSLESEEFSIKFADYDLGKVSYLLGRDAFEFADEQIVSRPIVSINSDWRWDAEGLSVRISGNCGFPALRTPELQGHRRGDSYDIEAQMPWVSVPDLFPQEFVEIMRTRVQKE